MKSLLRRMASLRVTVWLLVWAMVLVFLGTLAQARIGVWEAVDSYFRSPIAWMDPGLVLPGVAVPEWLRIPIPGGLVIGVLMILNLLAAHTVRFRLIASRIGIVILHAGLIVLLLGEFGTGLFSREGLMRIDVDGSANFVEDLRRVELAVIDPREAGHDRVISIPGGIVAAAASTGERITHEALPFELAIESWMPNAQLLRAGGAAGKALADRGAGREAVADPVPKVRGVDGGSTDVPACYVTIHRGGERLGKWLLSADFKDAQALDIDDVRYGLSLRFARTYKPYTVHLKEFRHDKFVGTEVARNFSSRVRLVDPRSETDREVVIWMNNPLRHAGETFYQASYKPDGSGTVLQVVHNPAAWLPYIASTLVGVGMTLHFLMALVGYMRRSQSAATAMTEAKPRGWPMMMPWLVGTAGVLIACSALLRPAPTDDFNVAGFATIPVSAGGRVKPIDTAARHLVSLASGRQSVQTDSAAIPASRFLLDLVARPDAIRKLSLVRVDHPGVLALLGLPPEDAGRLSLDLIETHWEEISRQAGAAEHVPPRERDPFQRGVIALHGKVNELLSHAALENPYTIPPMGPDAEWDSFRNAFATYREGGGPHPAVAYQVAMMTAWNGQDAEGFNKAVEGYLALLERDMAPTMRNMRLEVLFNRARLFAGTMVVYTLAFLVVCIGLLMKIRHEGTGASFGELLRRGGVALLWAAVIVHTLAIALRIHLQGRPPVTNLYSSAIFVGWAAVLIGLALEHWHRLGVAALGASAVGFSTLIIAHNLGSDGDTMQMMQAVLDSNFWLATHVTTITLGYSTTFLAGAMASLHIVLGAFTNHLTPERSRALVRMVYATASFALLLSFVGTVLGGIWADQSWGRFWGWDPKENGAVLVVLTMALILHAKWGGMIRERGLMALAVFGNIVTAWSWFGTNMLGVGLHSYGFMNSAVTWMLIFVASQLLVIAVGLVSPTSWRDQGALRESA